MWEEYGIFMQYSLDQSDDSITNNHFGTVSCEYLIDLISFIKVQRLETPVSRGQSVCCNYYRPKHEEYYSITWAILSRIAELVISSTPEICYIKCDWLFALLVRYKYIIFAYISCIFSYDLKISHIEGDAYHLRKFWDFKIWTFNCLYSLLVVLTGTLILSNFVGMKDTDAVRTATGGMGSFVPKIFSFP